ncbi:hypothetical protein BKH43_02245 [Helicobacter sp. 13S00401-1]|uniref:hypothetical protein n=1 Tax=Helicobacter sp. 13S00401-1 TaxID=1905758 RepID=UPI000BA6D88E|nr:hypothetical protein [Helicobacter sp. 13S00401-1]PAF51051.1 hypothetical protein BKH43_02245 [Helicobacter sp. 13S00401-1]
MKKIVLVFLALVGLMFAADNVMYPTTVKSLYQKGSDKVVGRLLPTSAVKMIKQEGKKDLIQIEGYSQEGVDNAIYYAINRRILVAGLAKSANIQVKKVKEINDKESGKKWYKVEVQLYTDSGNFSKDVQSLYSKAKALYGENCSICHGLHATKEFNANQWPGVVDSMFPRTGIPKEDKYLLVQYLQKNASDMPGTNTK